MCLAWIASLRSEDPFHKVGCAALNSKNRVIATGYNGLNPGQTLTPEEWQDRVGRLRYVIHAEHNALSLCVLGEIETLACTTLPCPVCAELIIAHGVKRVLYGRLYHRDSSAVELFKRNNVDTTHIPLGDVFRAVSNGLLTAALEPSELGSVGSAAGAGCCSSRADEPRDPRSADLDCPTSKV